jgi:hypothetical protein
MRELVDLEVSIHVNIGTDLLPEGVLVGGGGMWIFGVH